jgi:hypothetical protein
LPTRTKPRRAAATRFLRANAGAVGFGSGFTLGFLLALFSLRSTHGLDWSAILVVITAAYVLLTYLLLRTSLRQAAASEQNIQLIHHQMAVEERRKAGPIDVLARDVQERLGSSQKALHDGMWGQAVLFLPERFDQVVDLSATVDLYLHYELTNVQKAVSRLNSALSVLRSESTPEQSTIQSAVASAKTHLKSVLGSLYNIRASINGWNEEEGQ